MAGAVSLRGATVFATVLLLVGVAVVIRSWQYGLTYDSRMGPGAFPAVLGVLLTALGGWLIIQSIRTPVPVRIEHPAAGEDEPSLANEPNSARKAFTVMGLLAIAVAVAPLVGLIPALTALVFVLAFVVEQVGLQASAIYSVVCFALYYGIFDVLLDVPMPGPL